MCETRKLLATARSGQELDIALAAAKRRNDAADDRPSESADDADDTRARLLPHRRIAHDAFPDLRRRSLELRLDQRHEESFRRRHTRCGREDMGERDEAHIDGDEAWRLA